MNAKRVTGGQGDARPLVAHVVFRFDTGGLENGVVNLINRLPADRFRHAIIALTEITAFRNRVTRPDVQWHELHKGPGHGFWLFPRLYRLFQELEPAIVHTRNLAALEATFPAWLAGVPARVHGEHGRDVGDLDGSNRTYQRLRRMYRPFVSEYVALSGDLERYLRSDVRLPADRIVRIVNGVDTVRFAPAGGERRAIAGCPFTDRELWLVGSVGRLRTVKDQVTLARAFVRAFTELPEGRRLRLVIAGDGPLRADIERVLDDAGLRPFAWLPGERADVADVLRGLDGFVLPSLAEGISNTILEAMATGLPIVATRVGGNPDLIDDGITGSLVPSADTNAIVAALGRYLADPALAQRHGAAARETAVHRFSIERMVERYRTLYEGLLVRAGGAPADVRASG